MCLITMFLGHENVVTMVAKYDENLLLPLLMEANKLLMSNKFEGVYDLTLDFDIFLLMHKVASVCYLGGRKKNTSFSPLLF